MKNRVFWVCIILWVLITLARLINHQPWFDEAWAWILVKNFHFGSILSSLKYEGHFFVWYLLLLPFAKLNLWYPYSMLIMNWLCCFGAICLMWLYAPFNNWLKGFITFSFPFLAYYSIIARCYSVGILLLFVLCCLYKDKIKHPIIYSVIIFLCANTSLMALFGSLAFGILLIFDLFKNKQFKDLKICFGIAFLSVVAFILQTVNVETANIMPSMINGISFKALINPFFLPQIINIILLIIFIACFLYGFYKDKKVLFFITLNYVLLLVFFKFVYAGSFWHHYFFYIYLICASWLALSSENIENKSKQIITILLCIISFIFIFDLHYEARIFNSQSYTVAQYLKTKQNSRLILFNPIYIPIVPYLNKENIDIFNQYETEEYKEKPLDFSLLENIITENKTNYGCFYKELVQSLYKKNGKTIKFILDKNIADKYYIYRIEIIRY